MNPFHIFAKMGLMGKDGAKFISAVFLTLLLSGIVIFSGYTRDKRESTGDRVDIEEIRVLVEEGRLSFEEAEFYEVVESPYH